MRNTFSVGLFYGGIGALAPAANGLKSGRLLADRLVDVGLAAACKFGAILLTNPFYLLKTRAESMRFSASHTLWQDVRATYRASGLLGFYNGFWATVIRDVPYQGIQFGIYKLLGELSRSFEKVEPASASRLGQLGSLA